MTKAFLICHLLICRFPSRWIKITFRNSFFFIIIFNFLHGSFNCSHNTNNENYQKNYQKETITMYDILLKTPLVHVYNYFWWTVTLLELVWKQEINLPIYSPYKVNLIPSKLLWVAIKRTCDRLHWSPLSANRLVAS